jgi:hypothetical protein
MVGIKTVMIILPDFPGFIESNILYYHNHQHAKWTKNVHNKIWLKKSHTLPWTKFQRWSHNSD